MSSAPKPPNPAEGVTLGTQVATQQQGFNTTAGLESQAGTMVNQYNPYGALTYGQTGTGPNGVPLYSANVSLSPQQQQLFDLLQGTKQTAGTQASNVLGGAGYGETPAADVIGGMTSGNTKAILNNETSYLQPFFNTERDQLDTKLKNQGLIPGEPAYDNAMRSLDTSHGLTVSNFLATAEPQAYNQAFQTYNEPAQLAAQLAQLGAPGSPNQDLVNAPGLNIQPANLTGAVSTEQQALQNQYQAQLQQYQSQMSGMFGIPTAILGGWAKSGGLQGLGAFAGL